MVFQPRQGVYFKRQVHRCSMTCSPPLYALPTRIAIEGNIKVEDANIKIKESDIKTEEAERKFERSRNIKKENP